MSDQPIPRSATLRAQALVHAMTAGRLRVAVAALDASAAAAALAEVLRRGEDAAFLEIVVRLAETPARRTLPYEHRRRWVGHRPRRSR